ncbi:MAG TPA: hypothetical protein VHD62_09035 [Opitutaceae bacterium]|nr:hypothetical protein [Opitutaceae bacterium]
MRAALGVALLLVVHNFCFSLLPRRGIPLDSAQMRPAAIAGGHAFAIDFTASPADERSSPRSRVILTENDTPLPWKTRTLETVAEQGGGAWAHPPGQIVFSTSDNSDPRANGRRYVAHVPLLYSRGVGYAALALLLVAGLALRRLEAVSASPAGGVAPTPTRRGFWFSVTLAGVVFAGGLWCNTGTLAPYAITLAPEVDPATGYLYNLDREQHRTLFAFVEREPRAAWENSLLLRRVLYAVLARPWMEAWGYEAGGVWFNLAANLLGFVAGVALVRRHLGARGAIFAAWLLALYPGAAYWVGQPFSYAIIFPLSLAGFWALLELPAARRSRVVVLSLALGLIYLAYDFHAFFVPASLLVLLWQRRPRAAALSLALQLVPLALWLWLLAHVVKVPLENSNTSVYRQLATAYFHPQLWLGAVQRLAVLPEIAADVFFGANFLFLPLLALAAWALDFRWRDFTRHRAVPALLAAGVLLFVFSNLPLPQAGDWKITGSWIARIYQPVFPALVFSLALWWQELRPPGVAARIARRALVGVVLAANALICFGPVLKNPAALSETAFYRFYDHTDSHWIYARNLAQFDRRPIGFPRPATAGH